MAIKLLAPPGQGGNNNINQGGVTNDPACPAWGNPLAGATELTIAITLTPDALPGAGGNVWHNFSSNSFNSTFWLHQFGGTLYFHVMDESENFDTWNATSVAMQVGVPNRIVIRWRGSDHTCKMQINEQDAAVTPSSLPHAVVHVSNHVASQAPLEIGAISNLDDLPVVGAYAEAGLWTHFKSDADALRYGQGWAPSLLDATGRVSYMTLVDKTTGVIDQWRTFTGTFFEPTNVENAPHPTPVYYTPPSEETTDYVLHMHEDVDSLPDDGMELYELTGFAGKRSGTTRNVPADGSLQSVMNTAVRGDDILVALTGVQQSNPVSMPVKSDRTDLLMPPRLARRVALAAAVTMAATVNMSAAVTYGGEQVYIRVMTASHASLPKPKLRDIYLPDGTVSRVLHEDTKVGPAHAALMANTANPSNQGLIDNGFVTAGVASDGWQFRGVTSSGSNLLYGHNSQVSDSSLHVRGQDPLLPRRIVLLQCMADGDPGGVGFGVATFFASEGSYIAVLASYIDRYYTPLGAEGGEQKIFGGHVGSSGPWHYELNTLRIPTTFGFFMGSGQTHSIGVDPRNLVYRRNHHHCPPEWQKSEHDPSNIFTGPGWSVTIGAEGADFVGFSKVTYVAGSSWDVDANSVNAPYTASVIYEPTTGIARPIAFRAGNAAFYITGAWPSAPITTPITIYMQWAFPALRYNSGTVVGTLPTATLTNGSTGVTFSVALPADCEVGHYLYPNSTHFGGPGVSNQANDNGWGTQYNYSDAVVGTLKPKSQALRQKITAIAGNRLSCTLEFAWPGTTQTGAYSVVTNDGLWRRMPSKSFIETKAGSRVLVEGNVFDLSVGTGTLHPTSQGAQISRQVSSVTVTGDLAVATTGIGFPSFQYKVADQRRAFGHPWPHLELLCSNSPDEQAGGLSNRRIRRFINDFTVELEPPDPRLAGFTQITSYSGQFGTELVTSPQAEISHNIWRFNVFKRVNGAGAHYFTGLADGFNEITKGQKYLHHDNVTIQAGGGDLYGGGAGRFSASTPTASFIPTWRRWLVTGDSGDISNRHNTMVHNTQAGRARVFEIAGSDLGSPWTYIKSKNIELNDNLILDMTASSLALVGTPNSDLVNGLAGNAWDLPTTELRRNVFAGPSAPAAMTITKYDVNDPSTPTFVGLFPDNTALASNDLVGMHNLASTNVDDVTNYALDDIYTTGSVAIDATGSVVTLEGGGAWPATVVPGQFFRTSTSTTLKRITAVGSSGGTGLSGFWSAHAPWVRPVLQGGGIHGGSTTTRNFATHTATLGNDQWMEIQLPANWDSATMALALILRWAAPPALNGYHVSFYSPTGANRTGLIYKCTAGSFSLISSSTTGVIPVAGDVLRFEIVGSNLAVRINGAAGLTATDTTYTSGRAGIDLTDVGATLILDNFACGTTGAGPTATDNFSDSGASATVTLESAYPEAGVTGKSFAITFKDSGADGQDPGANIPVLAQMIQGVTSIP